ncbi:hypothetical protein B0I32_14058 [Nonomuraea fuscirosea]|uniref:Uncharacterized protein n=1 Tax=Nonomuraea fuscirosea TaxID=1291556 RepID=A0A2T0LXR0_9ACTN|nr:hypothetical protein [Nonomuraea fuscirosea]PRX48813.1 hypothetical protein B0I32_14058 [Nonomuraea fuscirosea]
MAHVHRVEWRFEDRFATSTHAVGEFDRSREVVPADGNSKARTGSPSWIHAMCAAGHQSVEPEPRRPRQDLEDPYAISTL